MSASEICCGATANYIMVQHRHGTSVSERYSKNFKFFTTKNHMIKLGCGKDQNHSFPRLNDQVGQYDWSGLL
jgi:phage gp36-like protein